MWKFWEFKEFSFRELMNHLKGFNYKNYEEYEGYFIALEYCYKYCHRRRSSGCDIFIYKVYEDDSLCYPVAVSDYISENSGMTRDETIKNAFAKAYKIIDAIK